MASNEQEFNTEIVHSLRAIGAWAYKIPDMPHFLSKRAKFTPQKPFDTVFLLPKMMGGAIESKFIHEWEAFGSASNGPTDDQMKELEKVDSIQHLSYVFLGIQNPPCLIPFRWHDKRLADRDSYKKPELIEMAHIPAEQGPGGKTIYDLSFILEDAREIWK